MNIEKVVCNNLCTGCGVCVGVCPHSALKMTKRSNLYKPEIDYSLCKSEMGCNICYTVCPGHSVPINKISETLFPDGKTDNKIGRFIKCYTGHSIDSNIRYHSASGGVATQLLLFMLESRSIDGVIVTRMNRNNLFEPEAIVATSREEVIKAQSSKYCPVSLHCALKEVLTKNGKFAIIGLPCHIHGLRKAESYFPELKQKICLYLGIYCSSTRNFGATEYCRFISNPLLPKFK